MGIEKAKSRNAKIRRYFWRSIPTNALRNSAGRKISSQPIKDFANAHCGLGGFFGVYQAVAEYASSSILKTIHACMHVVSLSP